MVEDGCAPHAGERRGRSVAEEALEADTVHLATNSTMITTTRTSASVERVMVTPPPL